jgi:threonine dehydratase
MSLPTRDDVIAAAQRIAPYAVKTPLIENAALNARTGGRVLLKLETLQRTGSFKFRGATNCIALIPQDQRGNGVVAFSSGNHAQGVAAAAALFGVRAVIVMPADAPRAKIEGTRALGGEVVFYDRIKEDREAVAAAIVAKTGGTLVRPFDDPGIVAGQGTVGLEILEQAHALNVVPTQVLAPCSGGGLVSGIALAMSGSGAKVFAVEPENFDGMGRSLAAGARTPAPGGKLSIADALMAPTPGVTPFALAQEHVAGGIAVTDCELEIAVSYALQVLKLMVEPGGAAGLAALLAGKTKCENGVTALVLSGGNADFKSVAEAVRRAPA